VGAITRLQIVDGGDLIVEAIAHGATEPFSYTYRVTVNGEIVGEFGLVVELHDYLTRRHARSPQVRRA
jgi:hypothetical protein